MEDLDLDAFIAGIEETAPEELKENKLQCEECGATLEAVDERYVCPNCSAQATNILNLEETEMNYDEQGRALVGQRVKLEERKVKHTIDYGWAWSTDDAVVHILALQISALEKAGLVPQDFRTVIRGMWLKFWIENIAPYIKDEYEDNELIPISARSVLKLRDIDVLVKVRDKVMIPTQLAPNRNTRKFPYKMLGKKFYSKKPGDVSPASDTSEDNDDEDDSLLEGIKMEANEKTTNHDDADDGHNHDEDMKGEQISVLDSSTRNISRDSVAILTLNRTLAFIAATSRCIKQDDPLFAADIIRACNQYMIPFYGAFKTLPEEFKLNSRDKLMFQKSNPPMPCQLDRAASYLINKIYSDRMPFTLPIPKLNVVIERFIKDMNLPDDLNTIIKNRKLSFRSFQQTCPIKYTTANPRRGVPGIPQYDRWAFAVLLCTLKDIFNLSDRHIREYSETTRRKTESFAESYFIIQDWLEQMSIRLKIILSYDPFVLFHPLAEPSKLETTPQMIAYVDRLLGDRVVSTTRNRPNLPRFDSAFRNELTEFLSREFPRPSNIAKDIFEREEMDKSTNVKFPITDAIERTERFWINDLKDPEAVELISKDFKSDKILQFDRVPKWCIYDDAAKDIKDTQDARYKLGVSSRWPDAYKLLLNVGAFLCFCQPRDLIYEVRLVEEYLHPESKIIKRRVYAKGKQLNSLKA